MTKVTEIRRWSADSVRNACIQNGLYTNGSNEDYAKMLEQAAQMEPSNENLFRMAQDIAKHSDDQTVSNVMYLLANQAVTVFFEIEE